jgi:PAS domain S-box-containing protein
MIKRYLMIVIAVWSFLVCTSLLWNMHVLDKAIMKIAEAEARAHFKKDQAFRFWGASHGGVYVPVDKKTPPNPYLSHLPDRDIKKPSGETLTLMNPAYMVRQMMDEFLNLYGVAGHITSLKPLNPENAPDAWEKKALESMKLGETEVFETAEIKGKPYLRLLRPMITKETCLKCHAHQGYKVGEIRGGVGISLPLEQLLAISQDQKNAVMLGHSIIWVIGLTGMVLAFMNLSQKDNIRTNIEAELIKREHQLAATQRVAKLGSWDLNLVSQELYWSDETYMLFDKYPEEFTPSFDEFARLVHPDDYKTMQTCFNNALKINGDPYHVQIRIVNASGREWVMEAFGEVSRDRDGKAIRMFGTAQDVTERSESEKKLKESEERYRSMFQSNQSVMLLIDPVTASIIDANPAALSFYGYSIDKITRMKITDINTLSETEIYEEMERAKKEQRQHFLFRHRLASGSIIDVEVFSGPVHIEGKKLLCSIVHDITNRTKAEAQVQASLREKEVLLQEIHHRVKNNFQVIISLLKLQNRNIDDENIKALLSDSENRIRSMSLVHEILYRTKDMAHIDFGHYVKQLTQYMFRTYKIISAKIIIKTEIKDIYLNTDTAIVLGLVINEIVSNAMKYAFPGDMRGEISISIKADDPKNEYELTIKDNGVGLPEGLDIWNTDTLGLRMVTNMVEKQLSGTIEIKRDRGTEYQIRFKELVYPDRLNTEV